MSEKRVDELLTGNYDGIQEYDNDLPRWWIHLFIITIMVSLIYVVRVHFMDAPTDHERLAQQLDELKRHQESYKAAHEQVAVTPEQLITIAKDPNRVEGGRGIFATRCAPCHGSAGAGLVGPNLTDAYWLHGGSIESIYKTIENGVPEKGMLAWKALMPRSDIESVTAFIWTIRNTNVAGKEPQGDKYDG